MNRDPKLFGVSTTRYRDDHPLKRWAAEAPVLRSPFDNANNSASSSPSTSDGILQPTTTMNDNNSATLQAIFVLPNLRKIISLVLAARNAKRPDYGHLVLHPLDVREGLVVDGVVPTEAEGCPILCDVRQPRGSLTWYSEPLPTLSWSILVDQDAVQVTEEERKKAREIFERTVLGSVPFTMVGVPQAVFAEGDFVDAPNPQFIVTDAGLASNNTVGHRPQFMARNLTKAMLSSLSNATLSSSNVRKFHVTTSITAARLNSLIDKLALPEPDAGLFRSLIVTDQPEAFDILIGEGATFTTRFVDGNLHVWCHDIALRPYTFDEQFDALLDFLDLKQFMKSADVACARGDACCGGCCGDTSSSKE